MTSVTCMYVYSIWLFSYSFKKNSVLATPHFFVHICSCREFIRVIVLYSNPALRKIIPYIIQQDVRTCIRGWSRIKLNTYTCQPTSSSTSAAATASTASAPAFSRSTAWKRQTGTFIESTTAFQPKD